MPAPEPAAVVIRGNWWRHAPVGGDPWYLPEPPVSNRWQRGSRVGALYLADSPTTAWAEWYRHLAERAVAPLDALPRDLWRWEIELDEVADLSSTNALGALGLSPPLPGRRGWPPYQHVGEALHAAGWAALLAPSAARPAGRVLCVFRDPPRPAGVRPCPPPQRVDEPPIPPRGMTT